MESILKTVTVDRETNKTIKEEYKEIDLNHDPWNDICKILADAFLESREKER